MQETIVVVTPPARNRRSSAPLIFAALGALAFVVTLIRYLTPLSGVTGAPGALLAMFGEVALVVAGLILTRAAGGLRILFLVLAWIGGVLTLVAELFLHGWWSAAALVLALVALAVTSISNRSHEG